ncbi:MAG TPA: segregation/condensation protein A [Anaerolineales bacterium]|nr:segregation/condensation protein A [Anaerolineales bacterium]
MLRVEKITVELPVFTGPLDLLLSLIEKQELDITKVALAQVTAPYLAHIRSMQDHNLSEISDFLVIAAKLLLIKSEVLLPRPPQRTPSEEDTGEELARLLRAYKQYKEVALQLQSRESAGFRSFVRTATPPRPAPSVDESGLSTDILWHALAKLLNLLPPDAPEVNTVIRRQRVTIRQKMQLIADQLRSQPTVRFFELLVGVRSRTEVIVTFLALLELIKQRRIEAWQSELFGDIEISAVGDWLAEENVSFASELEHDAEVLDTLKS